MNRNRVQTGCVSNAAIAFLANFPTAQLAISFLCSLSVFSLAIVVLFSIPVAQAQIIPDTTLPVNSQVAPGNCPGCTVITGGTERGVNLYHSFREFSVSTGGEAYFNNAFQIQNILTRVTGFSVSNIDGLIRANGIANLYLLNPHGIVFGPNASLNIGGSFVATTANSFKFPDGSEYGVTNPHQEPPMLTVNLTPGVQYGAIPAGSTITNRGNLTTGQDLILVGDRLDLQGQLQAGRDLTLQGQNTVQIWDTVTTPFLAQSGRDLTIQGDRGVDILALNHPQPAIQSGRNLSLISDGVISGDAHFFSGGKFQLHNLARQATTFTSFYDPIISSTGDVDIAAAYTGASLLIESLGSVRIQGAVTINTPDTVSSFMGDDAVLRAQPGLIIRSGQPTLVYAGNSQNPPAFTISTVPAGITLEDPVRVQPNHQGGVVRLTADNGGITFHSIDASSRTEENGGDIELTAKGDISNTGFFTDPSAIPNYGDHVALGSFSYSLYEKGESGGNITLYSTAGKITLNNGGARSYSSGNEDAGNGGDISFTTTTGNITLTNSPSESRSFTSSGSSSDNAGKGGEISFSTTSGNITLTNSYSNSASGVDAGTADEGGEISFSTISGNINLSNSSSSSSSYSLSGNTGKGGRISFSTISGNINLSNSSSDSYSQAYSFLSSSSGTADEGGEISFSTISGNINLSNSYLNSYSYSSADTSDQGGDISLRATYGAISGDSSALNSFSASQRGSSGAGGEVRLEAGSSISRLTVTTVASGGRSGDVQITGSGNLLIDSINIQTAQTVSVCRFTPCSKPSSFETVPLNGRSQAGDVSVDSLGNLTFLNSVIQSDTLGANPSGNISITSPGIVTFLSSQIFSNTSGSGNAGDITITAPNVSVTANSQIRAETNPGSSGRGGNVTITAPGTVNLTRTADGIPVVSVESNGAGRAGTITIATPQLTLSDAARITATATATSTNQEGGGSVTLNASNINLAGGTVGVFAQTQGQTPAGTLNLTPYAGQTALNVLFTPGSIMSASTSSSGRGGNFNLSAPQAINLSGPGTLSVETTGSGDAGSMNIATQTLNLRDGVQLLATTSNTGNAGNIGIAASTVNLSQGARLATTTSSSGQAGNIVMNGSDRLSLSDPGTGLFAETALGSSGNGGAIDITTRSLALNNGAQLRASTSGQGNAGNVAIRGANTVALAMSSAISTAANPGATGQGGDITVETGQLSLSNNAQITASTASPGRAGNVTISARGFEANSGGRVLTTTSSSGQAGNITIAISDRFTLRGKGSGFNDLTDTGIYAGTAPGSTGNGGSIRIEALPGTRPSITVRDGAKIAVNSEGEGAGGNIKLNTPGRITLDNRAFINATTDSGRGGNIDIDPDIVLLRRNSQISTSAGRNRGGGDGGNINITTKFLIAVPFENSDITANAYSGSGGKISITADRIFGFYRVPAGVLNTPFSDIAASSQLGINGTITLNNLNVDPSQGLGELNLVPVDGSQLIAQSCVTGKREALNENRFVIVGRTGLPATPADVFRDGQILTELGTPASVDAIATLPTPPTTPPAIATASISEAQSWVIAPNGKVRLVAASTTPSLPYLLFVTPPCPQAVRSSP